jgi:Peptidase A4 family
MLPALKEPPKYFKPIESIDKDPTGKELDSYGFPPRPPLNRPNETNNGSVAWKELMQACREYIPPPPAVSTDPQPLTSQTWSGAIARIPYLDSAAESKLRPKSVEYTEFSDYGFVYNTSTWIIPDACPPPDGDPYGQYACYSFVGFDGVSKELPPALVGGTKSICAYDCCHLAKVFIQWQSSLDMPATQEIFDEPKVRPGDLVSVVMWLRPIAERQFGFYIVNRNTGQYTRFLRPLPPLFEGRTAEWILGRQDLEYGLPGHALEALPNYGATYYSRNYAEYLLLDPRTETWEAKWETVDNAELVNMVSQDEKRISTAKKVGPNLLNVFAYNDLDQEKPILSPK